MELSIALEQKSDTQTLMVECQSGICGRGFAILTTLWIALQDTCEGETHCQHILTSPNDSHTEPIIIHRADERQYSKTDSVTV